MSRKYVFVFVLTALAQSFLCGGTDAEEVVSVLPPPSAAKAVDFRDANALPLPLAHAYKGPDINNTMEASMGSSASELSAKIPGFSVGSLGSGLKMEKSFGTLKVDAPPTGTTVNMEFGSANLPFSTSRADLEPTPTNDLYPYRATGKLFFLEGSNTYMCTASLVKRGVIVTAAHCVAKFGTKSYYSNWQFIPGYRDGTGPYGEWSAAQALVLKAYSEGTDNCQQKGVVCADDVAVIVLNPQKDDKNVLFYPGSRTGWYSYGWNREGLAFQNVTEITQLGFPSCLDNGSRMERTDAQARVDITHASNLVIGSLMCGGASGGPWLINFGVQPTLTGTTRGSAAVPNEVIGVTSWGSSNDMVKWMGTSPFLSTNIVPLVAAACKGHPDACAD